MELGADKNENGQKEVEQPVQKVKHSLLSRMWRQLSIWMTAGRPSKEVPTTSPYLVATSLAPRSSWIAWCIHMLVT